MRVAVGETLQDVKCPRCDTYTLSVVFGFVSTDCCSHSVEHYKMHARIWPFLVCKMCNFEEIAK